MARIFINPFTGGAMDLDMIPTSPGGGKFCPTTGQPLDRRAVETYSYPGPASDREAWAEDANKVADAIAKQACEPNASTLGIASVDFAKVAEVARAEARTVAAPPAAQTPAGSSGE